MDEVDPLKDIFKFIVSLGQPIEVVKQTILENRLEVSTVKTSDKGFETAICDSENVYPVQRYDSKEEAVSGHAMWIGIAKGMKHGDEITRLGWSIIPDKIVTITIHYDPSTN